MQHPGCLRGFSLRTTMIRTKDIMASLPPVASVPGNRYGIKVKIGGKQACTDGKTLHLPTLPPDCDARRLALARGYCDHEASHIRHTDFEALQAANLTAAGSYPDSSPDNLSSSRWGEIGILPSKATKKALGLLHPRA